jgi:hypothetical protein
MLEESGIPTVIVAVKAFKKRMQMMTVPRVLLTPHLMGRPMGRPGDNATHRKVIQSALALLASAEQGGTIVDF